MITKLFPGLIAVLLAVTVAAVLIIIVADRIDVRLVTVVKHFGG